LPLRDPSADFRIFLPAASGGIAAGGITGCSVNTPAESHLVNGVPKYHFKPIFQPPVSAMASSSETTPAVVSGVALDGAAAVSSSSNVSTLATPLAVVAGGVSDGGAGAGAGLDPPLDPKPLHGKQNKTAQKDTPKQKVERGLLNDKRNTKAQARKRQSVEGLAGLRAGSPVLGDVISHLHQHQVLQPRADKRAHRVLVPPPGSGDEEQTSFSHEEVTAFITDPALGYEVVDVDASDNATALHFALQARATCHLPPTNDDFRLRDQDGKQTLKLHLHGDDNVNPALDGVTWSYLRPEVFNFRERLLDAAPETAQLSEVNRYTNILISTNDLVHLVRIGKNLGRYPIIFEFDTQFIFKTCTEK
jgi:hypothetical protein